MLELAPLGTDAEKLHKGFLQEVLGPGTKIWLLVRSHTPALREYVVSRNVNEPAEVRSADGDLLQLRPRSIVGNAQVFGQHEIAELAKSNEKLTVLLARFVPSGEKEERTVELRETLKQNRGTILELDRRRRRITEQLTELPAVEEQLTRFRESGLEEQLKERQELVKEEAALDQTDTIVETLSDFVSDMRESLPIDLSHLPERAADPGAEERETAVEGEEQDDAHELEEVGGAARLVEARQALARLDSSLGNSVQSMERALRECNDALSDVRGNWRERHKGIQERYQKILRQLQSTHANADANEYIRLSERVEKLRPLRDEETRITRTLEEHRKNRRELLSKLEDQKREEFRELEKAAKRVKRRLEGLVQVRVKYAGNREPLRGLLQSSIEGRMAETIERITTQEEFSVQTLASACREGKSALEEKFGLTESQASRLADAGEEVFMCIEELELPATTSIELNIATQGDAVWKELKDLSTGQKATAILLLLLLESDAPLVVDQLEDDLDNRFITEGIVPRIKDAKRRRQFVFATHNANIPVLGDAELIVGLTAEGEAGTGRAEIPDACLGSIDVPTVCALVADVLEGGPEAFETRRRKYRF